MRRFNNSRWKHWVTAPLTAAALWLPGSLTAQTSQVFFSENFDGLAEQLGPFESETESNGDGTDWTEALPEGWARDNSGVPSGGVREFEGWTFLDPGPWNATAGQARDQFTKGRNVVAVADGDEWDDSSPGARMMTELHTPPISLEGVPTNSVSLKFDSSWRTEPQLGWVRVSFDGGEDVELLALSSETPDQLNETIVLPIDNPEGASAMVLKWVYEAGNNWWWAIDNIEISAGGPAIKSQPASAEQAVGESVTLTVDAIGRGEVSYQWFKGQGDQRSAIEGATGVELVLAGLTADDAGFYSVDIADASGTTSSGFAGVSVIDPAAETALLSENFDSVPLEAFTSETESNGDGTDWAATPPAGFTVNNEAVPAGGVAEFAGWTFLDPVSWDATAGQDRSMFTKGQNVVAVADGDEWDDSSPGARMTTILSTPTIPLTGIGAHSAVLTFDSSWRTEPQTGIVHVAFDGGEPIELLRYTQDTPSALNDTVVLPLENPRGATSAVISFEYEAGNNWWWAIDNLEVTGNEVKIVSQPVGGGFEPTAAATLTVEATGGELAYQWFKDGSAIADANGSSLSFASLLKADEGTYSVEVSNTAGSTVLSAAATIEILTDVEPLLEETFDRLELGPFVSGTESGGDGTDWTASAPNGWTVDVSGVPAGGVEEFAGWTFLDPVSWNATAGQDRDQFSKGRNVVAVADGDEWDDSSPGARMFTKLTSPPISLGGTNAKSVLLTFDSSWRTEPQTGTVEVSFDGGDPETILTLTQESPDALNETIELLIAIPAGASTLNISWTYEAGNNWWWAIDNVSVTPNDTLLSEDFDSVELGPFVSGTESGGDGTDWTATAPNGWTVDNSGVPAGGVEEFAGWTFLDPGPWNATAGQDRDQFTKGRNVVAVADGDEWDDASPGARMFTKLISPVIDIAGLDANTVTLTFDSSWRTEPQVGTVEVSFDGGEPQTLLTLTQESPDALNDTIELGIPNPADASTMTLSFTYEAGNNWWWAIDNVIVTQQLSSGPLYQQDFEELSDALTAFTSGTESGGDGTDWTAMVPEGMVVNNDAVPAGGVEEFAGWTFLDPVSWNATAGQDRDQFTKGQGVIAVADGDEWDDSSPGARMQSFLSTPAISLDGVAPSSVILQFDSSWRTEPQTGIVTVAFDEEAPIEILRYTEASPSLLNETVLLPIDNPEGASTMTITFGYEAGNNWWWAIDNIVVNGNQPVILSQPEPIEAEAGQDIALSVEAHGAVLFQWYKDGVAIPGATSGTLNLGGAIPSDTASYTVEVEDAAGNTATSDPVEVAVTDPFAAFALLSENFDGLPLEASTSPTETPGEDGMDWTATAPEGWTVDNTGVPDGGVAEFAGWTFVAPDFWSVTAGQSRDRFTKGRHVVAVGDGDEWDDSSPGARMFTTLISPMIDISGKQANSITIKLDSSWRTEPQTGTVEVIIDGGDPITLLELTSEDPDALNDTLFLPVDNPAGASTLQVQFSYEAGNNWWWAIDNVQVLAEAVVIPQQPEDGESLEGGSYTFEVMGHGGDLTYQWFKDGEVIDGATGATYTIEGARLADSGIYSVEVSNASGSTLRSRMAAFNVIETEEFILIAEENFDSVPLGDVVDEQQVDEPFVWTDTPPEGWTVDDSGVPGFDSPDENGDGYPDLDGVTEWAGWSFAEPRWWALAAGDQQRTAFTRSCGAVMIADPDEWDDTAHTPFAEGPGGGYDAFITSPEYDISEIEGTVKLRFDSSWRPEADNDVPGGNNQTAVIHISFDGGDPIEVLRWESDGSSPFFKPDATNEVVVVPTNNPADASTMQVTFGLINAGNDWWWAVDNLIVYKGLEPPAILQHPVSQQVFSNSSAEITVALDNENTLGEVTYQWYKRVEGGEREAIDGATSDAIGFASAQESDTGWYSVDITNEIGAVVSSCEARFIVGPLIITLQPEDLLVSAGDEACFFVDAEGEQPFTYQWFKGQGEERTPIDVAENDTAGLFELVIESATFDDEGWYSVEVSNEFGTVASGEAFLNVEPIIFSPPGEGEPQPATTVLGGMAEFITAVDGEEPVTYEWSFRPLGGTEYTVIEGATNFRLEIDNAQLSDVGFYRVKAINQFGEITSRDAKLTVQPPVGTSSIFAENFDGLPLGPNIDEGVAGEEVWTDTPPAGWTVDDSGVPGFDSPDENGDGIPDLDGATEWAGWAFTDPEWWVQTAGDQQRSAFTKGMNVVAVADPDEWDDENHTPFGLNDGYDAFMATPEIALDGVLPGSAVLALDSSWRPEADGDVPGGNNQTAVIRVSYDGGEALEVLRWESDSNSPDFKPDQEFLDESLTVALLNPEGARSMVITFGLIDAGNDWWWAIDNLNVTAVKPGDAVAGPYLGYWPFDDQQATTADLAGGNAGTVDGAEFVAGATGEADDFALSFDGVDDAVTTGAPILSGSIAFTISGWVKFDTPQLDRTGFFGQNDSVEFGMINATTMQNWLPIVGALDAPFETAPEWTHVAVTMSESTGRILYINGVAVGTADPAPGGVSDFGFNIGGGGIFDAEGNFFNGQIDAVAIHGRPLTASEIEGLASGLLTPFPVDGGGDGGGGEGEEAFLGSVSVNATGNFTFEVPAGLTVNIEYSTDLINWVPIATDVSGTFEDTDAARATGAAGYYRATQ